MSSPIPDRSRVGFWLAAIVLGGALVFVLYAFVGTFMLGLFVYYITRPVYRRLRRAIPFPNVLAATALLVMALPVVLLLVYTLLVAANELSALAGTDAYAGAIGPYVDASGGLQNPTEFATSITQNPGQFLDSSTVDSARSALGSAFGYLGVIGNGLIQLFVVFALAFYLLRDDDRLAGWFRNEFAAEGSALERYLTAVDHNLKTVFFGNILNAFATAIIGAIAYTVLDLFSPAGLGVPSPTLLGLLTGAGSLIPVIGMKIVWVPVALFLGVEAALSDPALLWFPVVFALVSLVIIDTIPDLVLRPYVSGRDLHTGAVMIAYIVGPLLFGWYGLFLGPLLLVAIVHFARIVLPELVRGEPITGAASAANPVGTETPETDESAYPIGRDSAVSKGPDADGPMRRDSDTGTETDTDGGSQARSDSEESEGSN